MVPVVEVLKKGGLTLPVSSVRRGLECYGISDGGPMDVCRCILANRLVGNPDASAVLECTLQLPELRFLKECWFSVVGGACESTLRRGTAQMPVAMNQTVHACAGDIFMGGQLNTGFRAYLSIAGGFLPASRHPNALENGDTLQVGEAPAPKYRKICGFDRMPLAAAVLRVTEGVHADQFTATGQSLFYSQTYTYTAQSDRMGIRFSGEKLEFSPLCSGNILSEGVIPGDIQVTSGGQPILMMADCQTVGGYTKIAHVISADLPIAAQLRPGSKVRFRQVMIPEAQAAWRKQQYAMDICMVSADQ